MARVLWWMATGRGRRRKPADALDDELVESRPLLNLELHVAWVASFVRDERGIAHKLLLLAGFLSALLLAFARGSVCAISAATSWPLRQRSYVRRGEMCDRLLFA